MWFIAILYVGEGKKGGAFLPSHGDVRQKYTKNCGPRLFFHELGYDRPYNGFDKRERGFGRRERDFDKRERDFDKRKRGYGKRERGFDKRGKGYGRPG